MYRPKFKIMIMKQYIFAFSLVLSSVFVQAQIAKESQPFMVRNLSADAIRSVALETTGGNISVTGTASNARLEIFISPNGRDKNLTEQEIKKRLEEEYDLEINSSNNKLTAKARSKKRSMNWNHTLNISFRAYVPASSSSSLATSGGNITLVNLSGDQDFSTSGGNLNIDNLSGKVKGKTSGGNIKVMHSRADIGLATSGGNVFADDLTGNVRLTTSGGSLMLTNLKGNVYASTSGGNVQGKDISGELTAHTSGGSIQLHNISGSLETSTSGGSISVTMREIGKFIKINNSAGNVSLELPGNKGLDLRLYADRVKTETLKNFSGKIEDDEINGKLNGGGIPVTVNAGSGRIELTIK